MDHGLPSVRRTRDRRGRVTGAALAVCLVLLMADILDAVERVILPLPPPIQGALAAGPYNFQFTGEDFLRLTVVNSLAGVRVRVAYRTAPTPTTTQTHEVEIAPTSDRVVTVKEFSVGAGYLLNLAVFASSGTPSIGHTFVKVEVIRGQGPSARVLGAVVSDYVTARQVVGWPGSPIRDSISGGGVIRTITGTSPAAGVEISETCPTGARWEVLAFGGNLATDVTVANRRPILSVLDAGTPTMNCPIFGTLGASATSQVRWAQGLMSESVALASFLTGGLPAPTILLAGEVLFTQTQSFQGGDRWTAVSYKVREWLEVN